MKSCFYVLLFVLAFSVSAFAQNTASVSGSIIDSANSSGMAGATVKVYMRDQKLIGGAICDSKGHFIIHNLPAGDLRLVVSSLGYRNATKGVQTKANDTVNVGRIRLIQSAVQGQEVEVEAEQIRGEQKGDTTEFNAKAFKTDKNASAEDLVKKMPGVEVENGQVKAHGEQVKRVLVDGKPFFGDDPAATLKALPSDIIDKVQVYDQGSDQSQFTRFDDGERNKTINVVTKPDKRVGQFGKFYAGYGTDDRYNGGGNINYFNGDQRISLLGLSNNINEQNFSMQDIIGTMGGGGGQYMRMAGRNMAMFTTSGGGRSSNPRGPGGGMASDFSVAASDGISKSNGIGLNYSDQFGKSFALSGSYFFNRSNTAQVQAIDRIYYLSDSTTQTNLQNNNNGTINLNHRLNVRADYSIDSMSSILLSPRWTWQSSDKNNNGLSNTVESLNKLNESQYSTTSATTAHNFNTDLLYRLRFATEGRTLSSNINTTFGSNSGSATNISNNTYYGIDTIIVPLNQQVPSNGTNRTVGGNLTYTEPLARNHQLQLSYNFNDVHTESSRMTYGADSVNQYSKLLPILSNSTSSNYITHRPGVSYRFSITPPPDSAKKPDMMMMMMGGDKGMGSRMMNMMGGAVGTWTFGIGADYQIAQLKTEQTYPLSSSTSTQFLTILPNFSLVARPSGTSNIRFNYRTSTNSPSITQLQDVVDNSDPLHLSRGNSQLKQEYSHSIFANYGSFNIVTASGLFAMVNLNITRDRIVNSTTTNGVVPGSADTIRTGSQYTTYVNRDGFMNGNAFLVYSFPVEPIKGFKLNMNTNAAVSYTHDINLINQEENVARTWVLTPSIGMSSNISEYIDFSLSGRTAYSKLNNSIQSELNSTYMTSTIIARGTFISHDSSEILDGWLINFDFNYIITSGLGSNYNRSVPLLNAGIGRRFLDGRGELKLSVFDALSKNNAINRSTGSGYVEDSMTQVLQRYFMLTFTYNLRAFGR